jgi:hypothetical protein
MIDHRECGTVGRIRIGRGNRSTRRKPAPVPLSPPQIPHDLTWARTRAAAVGSRWLTAWAMVRPLSVGLLYILTAVSSWFFPVSTERYSTSSSSKFLPICNTYLIPSNLISCYTSSKILTQLKCKIMIRDRNWRTWEIRSTHTTPSRRSVNSFNTFRKPKTSGNLLCLFSWINDTYFPIKELSKLGQISCNNFQLSRLILSYETSFTTRT